MLMISCMLTVSGYGIFCAKNNFQIHNRTGSFPHPETPTVAHVTMPLIDFPRGKGKDTHPLVTTHPILQGTLEISPRTTETRTIAIPQTRGTWGLLVGGVCRRRAGRKERS